jgi:plastocyanin
MIQTRMRTHHMIAILASTLLSIAAATTNPVVHQKGRAFSMSAVTLAQGEQIVFLNDDTVPHNIMSTSKGNQFDLGTQMPGTATPVTFTHAGIVVVVCAIHPRMHMTITVTE